MVDHQETPRLSGALRAQRDSNRPDLLLTPSDNYKLLTTKRRKCSSTGTRDWSALCGDVVKLCSKTHAVKVRSELRDLRSTAQDLIDSSDGEAIDEAAVYLYELFIKSPEWSRNYGEDIRRTLGPYPASVAIRACNIVKGISLLLPPDDEGHSTNKKHDTKECQKEEFGLKIMFMFEKNLLNKEKNGYHGNCDSDDDVIVKSKECDMVTTTILNEMSSQKSFNIQDKQTSSKHGTSQASSKYETSQGGPKYGTSWLQQQCRECAVDGLSWQQLYAQLFDLLISQALSIENELVELLGFNMDLIQALVTNRQIIVDNILNEKPDVASNAPVPSASRVLAVPSIARGVVVQSQEEKQLQKQMKKDNRKEERQRMKKEKQGREEDHAILSHDPHILRKERELSLEEASKRALFVPPHKRLTPSELYPNVYDTMSMVKQSASFIAGNKVGIPESAIHKKDDVYEEIFVPHSSSPPPLSHRIPVSDLEDVIKTTFATKSLNIIQSAVYDVAFHTNENLLVCAPTGAGKTNIAMLTILREIINNTDDGGVLKRNEFKVVYIAPMKALAAEMVRNFGQRLSPLGIAVKELTGDMQLTKYEIQNTQMIVTTPEKWDVVTRKATGDVSLAQIVRLLIIDEVHLLHEDRGAVIECLVARTLRQVESSQKLIRIAGLSATLPNYTDVARFLRVNPYKGLFYFDGRFRPVPLSQSFVGIKATNRLQQMKDMDDTCYDIVLRNVRKGYQVMVFVHARNATVKTATTLKEMAAFRGDRDHFAPAQTPALGQAEKKVSRSRYKPLKDLFSHGFGVHHAGMIRHDRNIVEKLFSDGLIKVLVCTATLAWGVNLPAHAVVIKGTQIYDANKGSFVDLGVLDVLQIFGRAGRPQFDSFGEATILTTHDKLAHYVSLLTQQQPIESQLVDSLADCLNAEIALGTVGNIEEAEQWLTYTYLYVRMQRNPLAYGVGYGQRETDPTLKTHRLQLIQAAANALDKARMVRYVQTTGTLHPTDLGRTASHYYIKYTTIEMFNEMFKIAMTEADVVAMVAESQEFEQIKVREEEIAELEEHLHEGDCMLPVKGGVENTHGKVSILIQTYISRGNIEGFSLVSDLSYVSQNSGRIMRGLFDIAIKKAWSGMAAKLLTLSKSLSLQQWSFQHPLRQFSRLSHEIMEKLENKKLTLDRLRDMTENEIGHMISHLRMGKEIKKLVNAFPSVSLSATIQPITRTVLRVKLSLMPEFTWDDRIHGNSCEPWWIWVEDPDTHHLYHVEYFLLQRKQVQSPEAQEMVFTIPIFDPLPPQYYIRAISDRWIGCEAVTSLSFKHLILPDTHPPHSKLLDLHPLPTKVLKDQHYEQLYKFDYFNPVQTQIFHTLYHSDTNVLLGAPTGSGKTVAAELAMFRVFNQCPGGKCVYIAPLKALVRERIEDWSVRLEKRLGKNVVELTGDTTPDIRSIERADVIVTTPEKWDGISRSWQNRAYVQAMRLLIIDEIHLLGDERGPVLEVIVSRTNFIGSHTHQPVRVVGLSTALANAHDLANWLGVPPNGLFNFHPAVRPVQLEVHISGFPGKHYCPRMATMNKPSYTAIRTHSPSKPVLIFVSSRRQTRLTAFDLASYVAMEDNPKQWLYIPDSEMDMLLHDVKDANLKFTLAFGIGLHHAGLQDTDRKLVEELFVNQKIQILIATATLAWGVNFPAHLVIVKGTEYYDGKTHRYIDYPITDVLQMMGRAGRPQYDDYGVACIFVQDSKKDFYKKFLYEPFPVESSLQAVMPDHINAEIVAGTITSKQDIMDYITWTYYFRRLLMNPTYYQLDDVKNINQFLTGEVDATLTQLQSSYCINIEEDDRTIQSLTLGCIASYYYLHHLTVKLFKDRLHSQCTIEEILRIMSDCSEYAELPVRHNEDQLNSTLAGQVPIPVDPESYDSPHVKTCLLLQAHFTRVSLPVADYITDTKSVLDQSLRILQALVDISANEGWLSTTLQIMMLSQMCVQGRWSHDPSIVTLPYLEAQHVDVINRSVTRRAKHIKLNIHEIMCLAELLIVCERDHHFITNTLGPILPQQQVADISNIITKLPIITVRWEMKTQSGLSHTGMGHWPKGRESIAVPHNEECIFEVVFEKSSLSRKVGGKVHAPRFPKAKDEGWWLVLGCADSDNLVAMKRVVMTQKKTKAILIFSTCPAPCYLIYTLYLVSDCYMGIDQQFDIHVHIT